MITCDVTCSSLAGVYLTFLSVNTVRSQDVSGFSTLANDPHSLFPLSSIPITVRGCCVPPVKSICLISKNVAPLHTSCNHCPHCTQKLPWFAISCCGCWLQRPSPCAAPSTVPTFTIIHNSCSHPYRRNPWPSDMGDTVCTIGWGKQGVFWSFPHWTPTTTSWSRQCHTCNAWSPNPSSMPFSLMTSSYTSFSPWWPVLVRCSWIPLPFSKTGKVPSC